MTNQTTKKRNIAIWIIGGIMIFCLCASVGLLALGKLASMDPSVQATGTARAVKEYTETAQVIVQATQAAMPIDTETHTYTPTINNSPTSSPTSTLDPSITPPTPTSTATSTNTATFTASPSRTLKPTNTPTPTKTPIPSKTPTITNTPTAIPDTAGLSEWIAYEGKIIGVRDISFNNYLGYYRPETGKIFVSIYIVAINQSDSETTFYNIDMGLVDGGGEVNGSVFFGTKEPSFSSCTVKPGGACEGWWTTEIWDRPEVKDNLTFRWDPCLLFCSAMEVKIDQNK